MTKQEAWDLLCEYNQEPFHRHHGKTVGAVSYTHLRNRIGTGIAGDGGAQPEDALGRIAHLLLAELCELPGITVPVKCAFGGADDIAVSYTHLIQLQRRAVDAAAGST